MGLSHSPSIVTDGLVLCLDAANRRSYPGSGTSWLDLSGNGNNATLTTGPTFSSENKGGISFDAVDDYCALPHSGLLNFGTELTISCFGSINDLSDNQRIFSANDVTTTNTYTEGFNFFFWYTDLYGMDAHTLCFQFGQSAWRWNIYSSNGITIDDTDPHFMCVTASSLNTTSPAITLHIDNDSVSGTFWSGVKGAIRYSSDTDSIRIGSSYQPTRPSYSQHYDDVTVSQLSIYNRALTADEVRRNYLATKSRFLL